MAASTQNPSQAPAIPYWTTFRTASLTLFPSDFARYSRAGVDPYIISIGKGICNSFPLCREAKRHLGRRFRIIYPPGQEQEIKSKRGDLETVLSDIAASEEGLLFLGILGVLTEYFDEMSAALILEEVAKWKTVPEDLKPSLEGWEGVFRACGGQLKSDEFSAMVEKYTELGRDGINDLQHTDKETVVAALNGMADQYKGRQKRVLSMYIGNDAGWVTAAAEWLFDLRIELRSRDNRVLYSNCEESLVQISARFQPPGVPVNGVPIEIEQLMVKGSAEEREEKKGRKPAEEAMKFRREVG